VIGLRNACGGFGGTVIGLRNACGGFGGTVIGLANANVAKAATAAPKTTLRIFNELGIIDEHSLHKRKNHAYKE
jgi:nitrate/nitrite transporter NarK